MWAFLRITGDYIQRLLNAGDHTADVVLLCYFATVIADLFWLSHGVYKGQGFTDGWNSNFLTLASLVGITKVNNSWTTRSRESADEQAKKQGEQK